MRFSPLLSFLLLLLWRDSLITVDGCSHLPSSEDAPTSAPTFLGRSFRHKVHFLPLSLPPLPPPLWKLTGIAFVAWIVFNFGFYVYFYLCMCISHHSHLQLISSCLFLRTLDVSIDSIRRAIRNVIQLQAIAVASGGRWDEFRKKYK